MLYLFKKKLNILLLNRLNIEFKDAVKNVQKMNILKYIFDEVFFIEINNSKTHLRSIVFLAVCRSVLEIFFCGKSDFPILFSASDIEKKIIHNSLQNHKSGTKV